ncbi:MAG: iron-sulfur cluster assembly protein [Alphaproteobacteria bacterium]
MNDMQPVQEILHEVGLQVNGNFVEHPRGHEIVGYLRSVFDPEIPVNIFDLGLIYRVDVTGDGLEIDMTLTAPGCPVAEEMPGMVSDAFGQSDLGPVRVDIVWEPAWDHGRMSEIARLELGFL